MVIVRFPTGLEVKYPDATLITWHIRPARARLMTKKKGSIVAVVPVASGCTFEFIPGIPENGRHP